MRKMLAEERFREILKIVNEKKTVTVTAYTSQSSGTYVLKTFVNHLDAAITDPYIYNNAGCTPLDAVLVWQDEENLVTNVRLSSDKHIPISAASDCKHPSATPLTIDAIFSG